MKGESFMNFRQATIEDVELLVALRKQQLVDEGLIPNGDITVELTNFFTQQLSSNSYTQVLALNANGEIEATGAIIYYAFPPSYYNHSGIRGYIANMYTLTPYRGKGLATKVLDQLVLDAKSKHVQKLFLYGSEMGKPVYKRYGFEFVDAYMEYTI